MGDSPRASKWSLQALKSEITNEEDAKAHRDAIELLEAHDPSAKEAVEQARDKLGKVAVPVAVEEREDGYKGEDVPDLAAGDDPPKGVAGIASLLRS